MPVRVVTAAESVGLESACIESGTSSRALMRTAGHNAASILRARYADSLRYGVTVFAGSGNNGGDGWVLAGALHASGIAVRVREVAAARTPDSVAEREPLADLIGDIQADCRLVVDAVLGTGATGEVHGPARDGLREIAAARAGGATVVALDLPTGVTADTGAGAEHVIADLTISFGSCKRGSLMSRGACGEIVVVDIGIGDTEQRLPSLIDAEFVRARVPPIAADAYKGTRRSVAIVAGAENMGGAAILAATAALRSGVGLVKVVTAPANVSAMHTRIPEALVAPLDNAYAAIENWADAVLIGPGLGTDDRTRDFIRDLVCRWRGPSVLDAGALSAFDGDVAALADLLRGRPAVLTPHPGELAKLLGHHVADVLANRFEVGAELARESGAAVLLKGTPSVVFDPNGDRLVVARGTPVLATGGSGDALSGMIVTLLAQGCEPAAAAACGAWVHGRAAELIPGVRGYRLSDVLDQLPEAWRLDVEDPQYPAVATLPAIT